MAAFESEITFQDLLAPVAVTALSQKVAFPSRDTLGIFPVHGDTRLQNQAKADLDNRYSTNPRTPLGLAGLLCCRARIEVLGISKIGLSRESGITRDTLAKIEGGITEPNTFRRLLIFFRQVVLREVTVDPVKAMRLENFRTRIAGLLVKESAFKHPINQIMLDLGFRYGKERVEQAGGFNLLALRARDKKGGCGVPWRNYQAVSGVLKQALTEEQRARSKYEVLGRLWQQKEIQQLVALEVAERLKPLAGAVKENPEGVQAVAVVLTLCALRGAASRAELVRDFKLSNEESRALPRGEMIEPKSIEKILNTLATEEIIPRELAAHTLENYNKAYRANRQSVELPEQARKIHRGLKQYRITPQLAATLLDVNKASAGFVMRKQIDTLSLESGLFSFHALSCLAAGDLPEAETLVEELLKYSQNLPGNAGREFSYPFQLAVAYGLSADSFSGVAREAIAERFSTVPASTPSDVVSTIMERGDAVSVAALNRWNVLMKPETVQQVACSLDMLHPNVSSQLQNIGMAQTTLRKYQSGALFPSLERLESMLQAADVVPSTTVIADWFFCAANQYVAGQNAFDRAVMVYIQATAGNGKAFYLELSEHAGGDSLALSLREFQKILTQYVRGERPELQSAEVARESVFCSELEKGGVPEEVLRYLSVCQQYENSSARLLGWKSEMTAIDRSDLIAGFDLLVANFDSPGSEGTVRSLQQVFAVKQEITKSLAFPYMQRFKVVESDLMVKALKSMPGVTPAELREFRLSQSH